jgi:hypothetical protein
LKPLPFKSPLPTTTTTDAGRVSVVVKRYVF